MNSNHSYHPQKLSPREHIRRRPGMYVGGINRRALHHLFYEVLDNPVESAFIGKCDTITVHLQPNNTLTVEDNDVIFPEKLATETWNTKYDKHVLDVIMTEIGWNNKFDKETYRVTGGLHGVGLAAICALSSKMTVMVRHNNMIWKRFYREGLPYGAVQYYRSLIDRPDGFTVTFQPDFSIMEDNDFDYDRVAKRCADVTYTTPNLTIHLIDERQPTPRHQTFNAPSGMRTLLEDLNAGKTPLHDIVHISGEIDATDNKGKPITFFVEIAMQYTDSDESVELNFLNTVSNIMGGVHVHGFQQAILGKVNGYFSHLYHPPRYLPWHKIKHGLTAAISIRHPDPQFESPTKTYLMNPEIFGGVVTMLYPHFNPNASWVLGNHFQAIYDTAH